MLSWLFKKRGGVGTPKAVPSQSTTLQAPADSLAKQADDARAQWRPRLQLAQGDDAALLRIAQASPVLDIKLAAVESLVTEEALKHAEREFRSHDRKVHRVAKQRLLAAVAVRETRARAAALVETATALAGEALLPANRLVALDRDWQALDAGLLDPAQCSAFSALRDRLDAAVRERAEELQRMQRWTADATRVLAALHVGCAEAAAGIGGDIAARSEAARELLEARPNGPGAAALDQALQTALQSAALVEARVAWLAALDHPAIDGAPAEASPACDADAANDRATESSAAGQLPTAVVEARPSRSAPTAAQRWRELPPLADAELAGLLDQRFEQWQRRQMSARRAVTAARVAPAAATASRPEQLLRLGTLLQQAEAALAEGQLGAMQQHLQAADAVAGAMRGVMLDDTLRARHQALHAERARLKGWQQWGGGLARDGLMNEAEELARLTLAADNPDTVGASKLHLKAHGDAIHALRARWKELDRPGAAASQAQWQRFDAALQTAHQPVAAQQAALKAARQDNLLAREALLAALDAVPMDVAFPNADEMAAHWKDQLRVLERFHLAWRQLGPLEHTVPAGARSALQQRLRSSVDRIELPLQGARRAAAAEREQFIVRAEALLQGLGPDSQVHGAVPQVRELQAQWRQHARAVPLPRALEAALWARFKAATDALFERREVAISARDAELAANLAAREALLERLAALGGGTPVDEVQRTLADAERAWRQAVELPRGAAGAVDARFRELRASALQTLAEGAQQRWHAQCDTLTVKLALCEEREGAQSADGDCVLRWAAQGALPEAWDEALAQRWSHPAEAGPLTTEAFDELLLRLEAAMDMPATPEYQAARLGLKLRAMKNALEGADSSSLGASRSAEWLVAALRQSGTTTTQRERLHALIASLRQASPGSLALSATRG